MAKSRTWIDRLADKAKKEHETIAIGHLEHLKECDAIRSRYEQPIKTK